MIEWISISFRILMPSFFHAFLMISIWFPHEFYNVSPLFLKRREREREKEREREREREKERERKRERGEREILSEYLDSVMNKSFMNI